MEERDLTRPQRRSAGPLLFGLLLAFVLGGALTAVAVSRWDRMAAWLRPPPAPVVIRQRVPVPVPVAHAANGADPALAQQVAEIGARLVSIEQRAAAASGDADRAEAMLVAFAARRAIDRGQSLGFLEGMLRERFGGRDAPAVALTIAAAQRPITLSQLQDQLDALSGSLAAAPPGEGWWTGVRRELGSLFVIRRAEVPTANPIDRLERARHALDQGQVEAAMAEVARLPGAARANGWLADARRYVVAHNALDRIETIALLKPPASTPAPVSPLAPN